MGGIGKTTLARNVYNHPIIVEHFDVRAWSTVSTNCNPVRIVSDVLHCTGKTYAGSISTSDDKLIEILHQNLHSRRYLVVLDDVWSEETFYRLKFMFPDSRNRSRIILTTRSFDLAYSIGYIHKVRFLDEDKTWDMLEEKIFEGDPCPPQLKSIGKDIAISCRGHPLSIEVVSGILSADQTVATWEDISENMKMAFEDSDRIRQILSLGYTYLPNHLRPCFLYLGIFPQNQRILVKKLIQLWVAEGFVNECGYKSLEEVGEDNVEDLVRRSLVSVSKRKSNVRIKRITVHDLMLDLSRRQARIDNFIHVSRLQGQNRQVEARKLQECRRVCNYDSLKGVYDSDHSLSIFYGDDDQLGIKCSVGNARLMRILDFSNAYYLNLPEEVFELYLAFDCWFSISEAISNLQNLQMLIICSKANGRMFDKLPEGIWRLPQLRHLLMFHLELLGQKGATSALENLQTLSSVKDFICSKENLKMIPNVKKLNIFYTELFINAVEDIELRNLISLHKLEILKIEIEWSPSFEEKHKMSFAFPPTLKKLNLYGLQLSWEDMNIVASLPNLEVLKLRNHVCVGNTWETKEGGFSRLTFLMIEESNLEHWIAEPSHLPNLNRLVLRRCLYLLEVPIGIGEIPTLELITEQPVSVELS